MGRTKGSRNKKTIKILDFCMTKIKELPYQVTLRYLYYQCVQNGLIAKKKKNYDAFGSLLSRARKEFWQGWHPAILVDEARQYAFHGELGYSMPYVELDVVKHQSHYLQVWFEAQAMYQQFLRYVFQPYRISIIPFKGQATIKPKWDLAKKLERIYQKYEKPIVILYFGDYDKYGIEIPENALKDIRKWCNVPFEFERVGLNFSHVQKYSLPQQPDKPNSYQWEALTDPQAKELITEAIEKYLKPIPPEAVELESELEEDIEKLILDTLHEKQDELDDIMKQ